MSREIPKVVARAASTLSRRIPVEARRDIQTEYALTASRINKGLSARSTGATVELVASGAGIGLVEFGARQSRAGTSVQVRVGNRKTIKNAFIAVGLGGNSQVFRRVGEKRKMRLGNYTGRIKQPIENQYGPSIAQMLRKAGREDRLADFAKQILSDEIDRLTNSNG